MIAVGTVAPTAVVLQLQLVELTVEWVDADALRLPVDGQPGRGRIGRVATRESLQSYYAKPVVGENALKPALDKIRPGDLVAHVEHVVPGKLTVCAIAFNGDLSDPEVWKRMRDHLSKLARKCEHIGPDTAGVVIAMPAATLRLAPWGRRGLAVPDLRCPLRSQVA